MSQDAADEDTILMMSEVMTPEKANFSGNIHGGHLLNLLDKVAYACAARFSGQYVVTLSVNEVLFREPIYVSELVTCYASINFVGRSSMEVGIKVVAENIRTQKKRHTISCYFTMVAVDENMKPTTVQKPLVLDTPTKKRRYAEAKLRRETRTRLEKEHEVNKRNLKF